MLNLLAMKLILFAAMAAGLLAAADEKTVTGPKPLPQEEQLATARDQIAEQAAEIETLRASVTALQAEMRAMAARIKYESAVEARRKQHSGAGCDLSADQSWICPPAPPAAAPADKKLPEATHDDKKGKEKK